MQNYLFKQISIVNEGNIEKKDIYIKKGRIESIGNNINVKENALSKLMEKAGTCFRELLMTRYIFVNRA